LALGGVEQQFACAVPSSTGLPAFPDEIHVFDDGTPAW